MVQWLIGRGKYCASRSEIRESLVRIGNLGRWKFGCSGGCEYSTRKRITCCIVRGEDDEEFIIDEEFVEIQVYLIQWNHF